MVAARGVRRNSWNIIGITHWPMPAGGIFAKSRRRRRPAKATGDAEAVMRRPAQTRTRAAVLARTMAVALLLAAPLGGCFSETYQKGYIVPEGALEQIPIGASQEQVLIVLGTPSTVATVS